ncbi:MAG TPA: hypothetical protein VFR58_16865 [Flavisolibacter sp.]|nr:hypothetical protein [Flavisolibacter sp.]
MKYINATLALSFLFLSCDKDDNGDSGQTDKTSILTGQTWKYESGGVDLNGDGSFEIPFSTIGIQSCTLDNTATFNTNGTGVADEGATKCDASLPQTTPFTWSFLNNQADIRLAGSGLFGLGGQFKVRALSHSGFSLSKDTSTTLSGVPVTGTIIVNLKH